MLVAPLAVLAAVQPAGAAVHTSAATVLYVATPPHGGNDTNACSQALPCATLQHAVDVSSPSGTIHIGAGTFPTNATLSQSNLTIVGAGQGQTFLDGGGMPRVMSIAQSSSVTTISDLTVQHGDGTGTLRTVGGINLLQGGIDLTRVTVTANTGTGVYAEGGGVNMTDSTISQNSDVGLRDFEGASTVSNSTFTGNGTGISDEGCCDSAFTNVTLVANGIGFAASNTSRAIISGSTIAGNRGFGIATASFMQPPGSFGTTVAGTIVANNAGGECSIDPNGYFVDSGYNLEADAARSCGFTTGAHDLVGKDPQLGALQNNGGRTQTMLPAPSSPVLNQIPNPTSGSCPGTDQRAVARPQGPSCDIGAVEAANTAPVVTTTPHNQTVNAGQSVTFTAAASGVPAPSAQWQLSGDGGMTFANIAGATKTSLTFTATATQNGKEYRVVFTNVVGPATTAAATLTVRTVPGTPTQVSAAPGNGRAIVAWTAPANNGGAPIMGYAVTSYRSGVAQSTQNFAGSATQQILSGLSNGKAYTFTVAARNTVGLSSQSAPSAAVVVGAPSAPTGVTAVKIANGTLRVTFTAGSNNGAPITSYTATCTSSDGGATKSAAGSSSPISDAGLTGAKTYTCRVTAKNGRGTGPPSAPSSPVAA